MQKLARVVWPEDMPKEALTNSTLLAALTALGSVATVAYSAAYLKDRAERQAWQNKIEKQLSNDSGVPVQAYVPESAMQTTPITVMPNIQKEGTLLTKLAEARRALTPPWPTGTR